MRLAQERFCRWGSDGSGVRARWWILDMKYEEIVDGRNCSSRTTMRIYAFDVHKNPLSYIPGGRAVLVSKALNNSSRFL